MSAHPETVLPSRRPRLHRNRPFLRYFSGFGLSLLGDQMWFIALAWAAGKLGAAPQTTLVMAAATLPRALLLLFGGTLADHRGPLNVALTTQWLRSAAMAAGSIALFALGDADLAVLLTLSLVFGTLDAAHMPAAAALPPHLLSKGELPAGQGAVLSLERTATIAGAPLGGFLVAAGGLGVATSLIAVLFAAAVSIMRPLRRNIPATARQSADDHQTVWRSFTGGLRYVGADPVLGRVLLAVTILNLALSGPLDVGFALLAGQRDWGAASFGLLVTGFAVGALIGSVGVAVRRSRPRAPAASGLLWILVGSAGLAGVPLCGQLPLAAASACFLGITTGPAGAYLLGSVQALAATDYLGRVMALCSFAALGLTPLSIIVFGAMATAFGLTATFLASAAALAVSAATAYASKAIRATTLNSTAVAE